MLIGIITRELRGSKTIPFKVIILDEEVNGDLDHLIKDEANRYVREFVDKYPKFKEATFRVEILENNDIIKLK